MNLARPPDSYQPEDQAQLRDAIVSADRNNIKKNMIIVSQVWQSPNGSKFGVTMSNAGALVVTPL